MTNLSLCSRVFLAWTLNSYMGRKGKPFMAFSLLLYSGALLRTWQAGMQAHRNSATCGDVRSHDGGHIICFFSTLAGNVGKPGFKHARKSRPIPEKRKR